MGLVLQWANLYGYVRCKVGGRSNLQSIAKNYLGAQLFKQVGEKMSQFSHPLLCGCLYADVFFPCSFFLNEGDGENRETLSFDRI